MFNSLITALVLAGIAVSASAGLAQAKQWSCAMTITRGGCPVVIYLPDPPKTKSQN